MVVQEEPKEPFVSSVLPWIILHRIIQHEEENVQPLYCQHEKLQNPQEGGESWRSFSSGSLFPPSHPSAVLWPDAYPLQRAPKEMQGSIYKRLQDCQV